MTSRVKSLLAVFAGSSLMWACATPEHDPAPVAPNALLKCYPGNVAKATTPEGPNELKPLVKGAFNPIPLDSVQFVDAVAARTVMVQSLEAQRTAADTVEIQARLVNCSGAEFQLEARTTFLTEGHMSKEPTSAWTRVFLQPHSSGLYGEKSLSRDVGHYLVEVRQAQ